jgi:hypothetical protein
MLSTVATTGTSLPLDSTAASTWANGIALAAWCGASTMSTDCSLRHHLRQFIGDSSGRRGRTAMPPLRRMLTMASASFEAVVHEQQSKSGMLLPIMRTSFGARDGNTCWGAMCHATANK